MRSASSVVERVDRQSAAWLDLAKDSSFAGFTQAAFKALRDDLVAAQEERVKLAASSRAASKRVKEKSEALMNVSKLIVQAMRADPAHGPDSQLIAASGFVAESLRKSGLMRKSKDAAGVNGNGLLSNTGPASRN